MPSRQRQNMRAAIYARQSRNGQKSQDDQLNECRDDAREQGYVIVAEWRDGISASRYARKIRAEWALLLAAVDQRDVDVVVLWESSRGDRTLGTWIRFLDLCRERDVYIWVQQDARLYDLGNSSDYHNLANAGISSSQESDKIAGRVRRGVASAARDGKPAAGPVPYGYLREREVITTPEGLRTIATQVVDPETAPVVQEIVRRIAAGEPVSAVTRDLNVREVPPPGRRIENMGSAQWYRERVNKIATSPIYVGKRVHRPGRGTPREGERGTYDAVWPALVTEQDHYAAVLAVANRSTESPKRPGNVRYLLTYLAQCDVCDGPISNRKIDYVCRAGHVCIRRAGVDQYVTELVLAYLTRPDVYAGLAQAGETADAELVAAREHAAGLRTRLEEWRAGAIAGRVSPDSFAAIEPGLLAQIREADARADRVGLPAVLRGLVGPGVDVRERWGAMLLPAQRAVMAELVTVRVTNNGRRRSAIEDRVAVAPRGRQTVAVVDVS